MYVCMLQYILYYLFSGITYSPGKGQSSQKYPYPATDNAGSSGDSFAVVMHCICWMNGKRITNLINTVSEPK